MVHTRTSLKIQNLSLVFRQFNERLFFGEHRDLIYIMRDPAITYKRARALYAAGCESFVALVNSTALDVEFLYNSVNFYSEYAAER